MTVTSAGAVWSYGGSAVTGPPTVSRLATGHYCIGGTGYTHQGGPYAATLDGYNVGGSISVNPTFYGTACPTTGGYAEIWITNSAGAAADDYFTLTRLA